MEEILKVEALGIGLKKKRGEMFWPVEQDVYKRQSL